MGIISDRLGAKLADLQARDEELQREIESMIQSTNDIIAELEEIDQEWQRLANVD